MPRIPEFAPSGIRTDTLHVCALGHVTGFANTCGRAAGYRPGRGVITCGAPSTQLIKNKRLTQIWFYGTRKRTVDPGGCFSNYKEVGPSGEEGTMLEVLAELPAVCAAILIGGATAGDDVLREMKLLPYPGAIK